jgi:hypothetical protein
MMRDLKTMILLVLCALLLSGCAGSREALLARDYLHMTNDQLLAYYYELTDEIEKCAGESSRASVGVGTGFGFDWFGIGVGVSKGIPACNPEELRKRRIDVRLELQRRGITP